jgi:hypothetical protein
MSLRDGYEKILMGDIWEALEHLQHEQIKGTLLDHAVECNICESSFAVEGY